MFVGRERELKHLEEMYSSDRFELAVIYGRRRVGKTELIKEFCRGKPTAFFTAIESDRAANLRGLSRAILSDSGPASGAAFESFEDAFGAMAERARSERAVLVIDEYPFLAKSYGSVSSILQREIDRSMKETKLFLILCGSSMSFMENQVLGYESPLYGRRTAQIKVLPLGYRESARWFPGYSSEEKAMMHGITGGIPAYLEQMDPGKSPGWNISNRFLNPMCFMFEEPSSLLKQELREPHTYNSIIGAIAEGKTKLSDICNATGLSSGTCLWYLGNLASLGIAKREAPVNDEKRAIYLLSDAAFRFWHRFVPRNMSEIQRDREAAFARFIEPNIPGFMGEAFEDMCRQYVERHADAGFGIGRVGQWWGGDPETKKQIQIDVVAIGVDGREAIAGSCKYTGEPVGRGELELLKRYARAMSPKIRWRYWLFSKSGFAPGLEESEEVRLVSLDDMYRE